MKSYCLQPTWPVAVSLFLLALGGCAAFSRDGGFDSVAGAARQHLNADLKWVRTAEEQKQIDARVTELLRQPLLANAAVQIALLNNRGLQASYQELGISEAEPALDPQAPDRGRAVQRRANSDFQYLVAAARAAGTSRAKATLKCRFPKTHCR
jgi:hypothetical protein